MRFLYIRCNGGHYYRSRLACPFDGWSCSGLDRAVAAFEKLGAEAATPRRPPRRGIPDGLLARLLVIEFGNEASAFEALVPERYIHGGREVPADEADESLV